LTLFKSFNKACLPHSFMRAGFFFIFLAFFAAHIQAETGITNSTEAELQVSSRPEAKLGISQKFSFPFLRGESPFTEGNNIAVVLKAEVTPISVNGTGEIIFTPAAFFLLSAGGQAGSGWRIPIADGIGLNKPVDENAEHPRKAEIDGEAFDGVIWSGWGAATLQFDLGALFPGDWTHVLFQTRQEFRYSAYSRAKAGEPWIFENDDAENMNGWKYRATYVLGYDMPQSPVLNMIAIAAELEKPLYSSPGGDFWGEKLGKWTFSGIFNFSISKRLSTALAIQMRTRRNHGISNFEGRDYYYQDFELKDGEGQRRIIFYRAALIFNYKIKN
jgi:hypothetical protein